MGIGTTSWLTGRDCLCGGCVATDGEQEWCLSCRATREYEGNRFDPMAGCDEPYPFDGLENLTGEADEHA